MKHGGSIGGIYNLNGWELSKNRIPGGGYILKKNNNVLEKKLKKYLYYLTIGNDFLNRTQKALAIEEK